MAPGRETREWRESHSDGPNGRTVRQRRADHKPLSSCQSGQSCGHVRSTCQAGDEQDGRQQRGRGSEHPRCHVPSEWRAQRRRRGREWLSEVTMGMVAVLALACVPTVDGRKWGMQWKDRSAELPRCTHEQDCGMRQECLGGRCMCPLQWGIADMPDCVVNTHGTWVMLGFVHLLSVLLLVLGYLHVRTLYEHLSLKEPQATAASRSLPSSPPRPMLSGFNVGRTHPSPIPPGDIQSDSLRGGGLKCSEVLQRLMTYKSLFCLFSLLFVGLSLARNAAMTLFVFDTTLPISVVLTGPYSVVAVGVGVGLTALTWAYLLVARIWLGLASHFHSPWLSRFAGSQASLVVLFVPGLLAAVPPVMIFHTNHLVARYLTYLSSVAVVGLVATGFMALGSSIMVPALKERAERAKALSMGGQHGEGGHQLEEEGSPENADAPDAPRTLRELENDSHRDRRSIVRMLRRKRRQLFLPQLDRISEAEKSALERSSSLSIISGGRRSSLDNTGSLRPNLSDTGHRQHSSPDDKQEADLPLQPPFTVVLQRVDSGPKTPGSEDQAAARRPSPRHQLLARIESGDEAAAGRLSPKPPTTSDGVMGGHPSAAGAAGGLGTRKRPSLGVPGKDDTARFDALPTAIARTALRIGQMNLLSFVCNLAQFFLLKKTLLFQHTEGAVLAMVVGLLGFPAAHIYANIVCLVAISAPAREGLESIHLLLYRLLDGFLLLLIALFGCGLDSVDLQRELGVGSGSNSAMDDP